MTREQAIKELKDVQRGDPETNHIEADSILCQLLETLGYEDVVKEFMQVRKWYS